MQVYGNSNRVPLNYFLLLLAVLLIAFLPISSCLFSLKNDAFTGYFPPKFFMSESIHERYLPLWNPYINFGIPQYGDMSSGYWNPITWLMAATIGYSAYSFTFEALLYILIGGIGMYLLTGFWKVNKRLSLMAATAYMCSGYNIGHLQHFNWLSGAAFLPWCFWSYLLLLEHCSLKNILRTAILFYFLVSSAHPGISISAFYFFLCISIFIFIKNEGEISIIIRIKQWGFTHVFLIISFLLLSAGMIAGYLDILPFFVRGEKISLSDSLSNPTNLQSWISALLPFVTVKNDKFYETDISMRNCYFSITLFLFLVVSFLNKKNHWQKFLLLIGSSFFLLSTGGIFKTVAYKLIPLIGYVRLNGEFRIFGILCFIIIATIELEKFISQKTNFKGSIKWLIYLIEILLITAILWGVYKIFTSKTGLFFKLNTITAQQGNADKLKTFIDAITFYDTFWIQGIIQLLVLLSIKKCIKSHNVNRLITILIVDMVMACLLNIPFTGVGKASVAQVQMVLNKSPNGIPTPSLIPIKDIKPLLEKEQELTGDWSMYNKQIGVKTEVPYPIILKNMNAYFLNLKYNPKNNYLDSSFIFIKNSNHKTDLSIQSFSPYKIIITANADTLTEVVLQQNFYPHWFYNNGADKIPVNQEGLNFMSAPIVKGQNKITFSFEPHFVIKALFFSATIFIIYCIVLLALYFKKIAYSIYQE